jgi:hypothetical protein
VFSSPLQQVGACRHNTGYTYTGRSAGDTGGDCTSAAPSGGQRGIGGGQDFFKVASPRLRQVKQLLHPSRTLLASHTPVRRPNTRHQLLLPPSCYLTTRRKRVLHTLGSAAAKQDGGASPYPISPHKMSEAFMRPRGTSSPTAVATPATPTHR